MKNAIIIGYVKDKKFHVLHMVLYEEIPTKEDIHSLKIEIEQDEEFKWINEINETIEAFRAVVEIEENKLFIQEKINEW